MILVCLECAADMTEIKPNVYRCPCCGWMAEQLTISETDLTAKAAENIPKLFLRGWFVWITRLKVWLLNGSVKT
ncbi:hypothetical protein [Paenibacillus donghaensis]|uniref:hypothetical protein n=1 Tax=Paenibacillus donghaensis TaxID=414771 RepID=UPI0014708F69|nr:hypothetical protein [Paenibacillus donghaensis]